MNATALKHTDSEIYRRELRAKQEQRDEYMEAVMKLYPCFLCGKVKYGVSETSITKICESDCEMLKKFDETIKCFCDLLGNKPDISEVLPKEGK
jgi:hypothetical protein